MFVINMQMPLMQFDNLGDEGRFESTVGRPDRFMDETSRKSTVRR